LKKNFENPTEAELISYHPLHFDPATSQEKTKTQNKKQKRLFDHYKLFILNRMTSTHLYCALSPTLYISSITLPTTYSTTTPPTPPTSSTFT